MTRRCALLVFQMLALCFGTGSSRRIAQASSPAFASAFVLPRRRSHRRLATKMHSNADVQNTMSEPRTTTQSENDADGGGGDNAENYTPPWSLPVLKAPSSKAYARFRQHVNPLSRRYQMRADLPDDWPRSDFANTNLPLYLDIGCGKGGFLLELAGRRHRNNKHDADGEVRDDRYMNITKSLFDDSTSDWLPPEINYLGLEIRPGVSQYAQARVEKRGLGGIVSFVGCNANVDLDRLLTLYRESADGKGEGDNRPAFVSVQFPDPHFKKAHLKRRVVTPALVSTLSKFMNEGDVVFLQSDILEALEGMRERFVEEGDGTLYFDERVAEIPPSGNGEGEDGRGEEYGMENPLGVPTEREVSVVTKGLPVYRTLFVRNGVGFDS